MIYIDLPLGKHLHKKQKPDLARIVLIIYWHMVMPFVEKRAIGVSCFP